MSTEVRDEPSDGRYEARVNGSYAGAAWYELDGDLITFTHTVVESAYEGEGVGSSLARFALDDARERGLQVVPRCPFIKRWITRHPDYADLVTRSR